MPNINDILWFKLQFSSDIETAVAGTPFDVDMITAIACQETGYIWQILRTKNLSQTQLLSLCVGDTLDADKGRSAFPRSRAELESAPNGVQMFQIAHQALVDMAAYVPGYSGVAKRKDKFCHGYGIFQYDIQFFKKANPGFFLERQYSDFGACLELCLTELKRGLKTLGWAARTSISDIEMADVAITYNTGGFKPGLGLKQGYKGDDGRYYGEAFYDYLLKSRAAKLPAATTPAGQATVPPPTPVAVQGQTYVVDTRSGLLNMRTQPERDPADPHKYVMPQGLPDGQAVRAVGSPPVNGFLEVETNLAGALLRGFVSLAYLKKASPAALSDVVQPAATPPPTAPQAVYMPRKPGVVTRRSEPANALSLNESGAPGRAGAMLAALCDELGEIIRWLAVDDPAHLRYQPHDGSTFCNIYAHDYCFLAGVYLPRVWWTPSALMTIAHGGVVAPNYGATIEEVRANGLFRWLRDFGADFGWRQTGTLTKLQQAANQGGIGLIVARRTDDGRPGHIVAIPPETDTQRADRDSTGEVVTPLQSQAGAKNFQYGRPRAWWQDPRFAEAAFWIHA